MSTTIEEPQTAAETTDTPPPPDPEDAHTVYKPVG
jgi:hypothetical protein